MEKVYVLLDAFNGVIVTAVYKQIGVFQKGLFCEKTGERLPNTNLVFASYKDAYKEYSSAKRNAAWLNKRYKLGVDNEGKLCLLDRP